MEGDLWSAVSDKTDQVLAVAHESRLPDNYFRGESEPKIVAAILDNSGLVQLAMLRLKKAHEANTRTYFEAVEFMKDGRVSGQGGYIPAPMPNLAKKYPSTLYGVIDALKEHVTSKEVVEEMFTQVMSDYGSSYAPFVGACWGDVIGHGVKVKIQNAVEYLYRRNVVTLEFWIALIERRYPNIEFVRAGAVRVVRSGSVSIGGDNTGIVNTGDVIDARGSRGFINGATGAIFQSFND